MRLKSVLGCTLLAVGFCGTLPVSFSAEPATQPKPATMPATTLTIDVHGGKTLSLTAADLAKLPHEDVKVKDHGGEEATYSGVSVESLLTQAGAPIAPGKLRGHAMGLTVIARGADGYSAAFGLADFSSEFQAAAPIVADARNGQPLDATTGPFRLIIPGDQRQGRWVRMVVSIHVRVEER